MSRRETKPVPQPHVPGKIIREIPTIERYARHNENDDGNFRSYLKARLKLSSSATDEIVRQTTEEIWKEIDCTKCANCCKTLQIIVDAQDIKKLAAVQNLSQDRFKSKYCITLEDKSVSFNSTPCPFLGVDNRCKVYENRPKACRDFPYLHSDHFVTRSLMMIDNTATCPIVFNVWQELKFRLGYRKQK